MSVCSAVAISPTSQKDFTSSSTQNLWQAWNLLNRAYMLYTLGCKINIL
jgi:hypothetical protein